MTSAAACFLLTFVDAVAGREAATLRTNWPNAVVCPQRVACATPRML